ncbi:TlpA family protein disulfide reductase [Candidatus Methylocalor cossyra]|uniref:Thiol-disulfide isomerase or thioredoxin n=1 Tax=Candidatus Methylocalor cossyra TaxID=3108543 RepID=A0ABM9NJ56_9GAMM
MITPFRVLTLIACLAGGAALAATGGPAPSCPVHTLDRTRTLDPGNTQGRVTYVDFWASWCGPCAQSFPFMNELYGELHPKGVEIIAVNLDEEPDAAAEFLRRHPARFTVAADPKGQCPALYGVKAMPTSFLIDRHGTIRHMHLGFRNSDREQIRSELRALLEDR